MRNITQIRIIQILFVCCFLVFLLYLNLVCVQRSEDNLQESLLFYM